MSRMRLLTVPGRTPDKQYNRRGLTMRDPEEGGKHERALADRYRAQASTFSDSWPRTAVVLRTLASMYDTDAREEDRAERFRQGRRKVLWPAGPSAARHSDIDADGRRAAGHARPARSSVRGEPPAAQPGRCTPDAAGRGAAQSTRSTWRVYQR